jgi:phosphonopyruvate decarboxylase
MLNVEKVYDTLLSNGIDFFTGVPDSLLQSICAYITDNTPSIKHIIAANEGTAVGIAAGHYMASGNLPLVYMQNSGLGNTVNPLLSLADEKVYSLPILLMIGWRGEPGVKDEPQHKKQGEVTLDLLDAMQIPYIILDTDETAALTQLSEIIVSTRNKSIPHAIIIRKDTFCKYKLQKKQSNACLLSREDALKLVVDRLEETDVVVSTTGKLSRELFEYRENKGQGHGHDFLTVGSMGHSSSIALGIALEQPERKVYCLDGDGAFIMHMGAVSNIGNLSPKNYFHILFNNGVHESVGGQPTLGFGLDIPTIAKACGYRHVFSGTLKSEIENALYGLRSMEGPVLLELRVKVASRDDLGRPTTTPVENKEHLMEFLKSK